MVNEVELVKLPLPLDDQVILAWFVADAPEVIFTAPELEQVSILFPAIAVGNVLIVSVLFAETGEAHGELGAAVNVMVTLPAAISAALGVYVAVVNEFSFAKVPVPFGVDHVIPELLPEVAPVVMFTAPELEQVFTAVPALAVGACVMVIALLEVTLEQPGKPFTVNTRFLVPAVASAALGL